MTANFTTYQNCWIQWLVVSYAISYDCIYVWCRYDVELYQRIEQLIGKQLALHPTVEEEVMALMERVTEAQRIARMVGVA